MFKRRKSVLGVFAATAAMFAATLAAAPPASADVLFVIDVSAGITAPASADGAFTAVATITNSGTLGDQTGSTLAVTATGGTISSAPGCSISGGTATCTAPALPTGQSASFSIGITPTPGATGVTTQAVATAALIEANVLDATNNTASTATSLAYAVDGSLTNSPDTVLTGDDTLLTVTVANTKAAQNVNAVLASGGTIDTRIALPAGCAVANAGKNVNCTFALGTGGSKSFDVAVATPANASSMTSTLAITGQSGGSKSASVTTAEFANAQAFVPNGDSLSYTGANQQTTFNVPTGSTTGGGTFLTLRDVNIAGTKCGTQNCISVAAEAIFPGSGKYSGQDINNPFIWNIKYNERQACNGVGSGSKCLIDVYWIGTNETQARQIALCPTYGTTAAARLNNIDEPCLVKVDKTQKGYATYTVAVLRDITIPIISSLSN